MERTSTRHDIYDMKVAHAVAIYPNRTDDSHVCDEPILYYNIAFITLSNFMFCGAWCGLDAEWRWVILSYQN